MITIAHVHKSDVIFHIFQDLSNKIKIKELRPKTTKIASRGPERFSKSNFGSVIDHDRLRSRGRIEIAAGDFGQLVDAALNKSNIWFDFLSKN